MTKRLIVIPVLLAACGAQVVEPEERSLQTELVEPAVEDTDADYVVEEVEEVGVVGAEVLEPHPVPEVARYTLRRGETPSHFARWSGLPVEVIAEVSGLALDGTYPVGTEVVVPVAGERRSQVEAARQAHHTRRADGYLASRGGAAGTEFYTVKTGDTAWSISLDTHGIPVWLLESYNPSVDLERLRPGQELMVPVLADVVVSVDE